jgi:hypothetical protein
MSFAMAKVEPGISLGTSRRLIWKKPNGRSAVLPSVWGRAWRELFKLAATTFRTFRLQIAAATCDDLWFSSDCS